MDINARIDGFEKTHLERFRAWAQSFPEADLNRFSQYITSFSEDADALTSAIRSNEPDLFDSRWKPLLDEANQLIAPILDNLKNIRGLAKEKMTLLEKGRKGLAAYQSTVS